MESFQELMEKHQIKLKNTYSNEEENLIKNIFNNQIKINDIDEHFLKNYYVLNMIGLYYYKIEKDYGMMKKYYLMAINLSNSDAMDNLGSYYKEKKNYEQMEKYYLMAIELGNFYSMNNLGVYYQQIKNYELMKKYYLMAIEFGFAGAMYNLGYYYLDVENDFVMMKKYYLMGFKLEYSTIANDLGNYFSSVVEFGNTHITNYFNNKNNLINNETNKSDKKTL